MGPSIIKDQGSEQDPRLGNTNTTKQETRSYNCRTDRETALVWKETYLNFDLEEHTEKLAPLNLTKGDQLLPTFPTSQFSGSNYGFDITKMSHSRIGKNGLTMSTKKLKEFNKIHERIHEVSWSQLARWQFTETDMKTYIEAYLKLFTDLRENVGSNAVPSDPAVPLSDTLNSHLTNPGVVRRPGGIPSSPAELLKDYERQLGDALKHDMVDIVQSLRWVREDGKDKLKRAEKELRDLVNGCGKDGVTAADIIGYIWLRLALKSAVADDQPIGVPLRADRRGGKRITMEVDYQYSVSVATVAEYFMENAICALDLRFLAKDAREQIETLKRERGSILYKYSEKNATKENTYRMRVINMVNECLETNEKMNERASKVWSFRFSRSVFFL